MSGELAKATVVEALSAVMADVQAVKKGDRNTMQNYNFRGIDAVVNAVGPALRTHGVVVVPIDATYDAEHYTTGKGSQMKGVTITVTFRFYGPAGDFIDARVCGEASDSGDKAVPKAHSVAYRTLLLQALCIPTDEVDPDAQSHERGKSASKPAANEPAQKGGGGAKPAGSAAQTPQTGPKEAELRALMADWKELKPEFDLDAALKGIDDHRGQVPAPVHVEWLGRQIDTLTKNIEAKRAESPFKAPAPKKAAA